MNRIKKEEEIIQVSQLVSDFADQDIQKRLHSTANLKRIAELIGVERTRKELIPFLRNQLIYDDSKIVLLLLDVLPFLTQVFPSAQISTILPILQDLLEHEEDGPRQKAITKYTEAIMGIELPKYEVTVMASLKKVYNLDCDEPKEAFCSSVASTLGKFTAPAQVELIGMYQSMAESASSVLRKHASVHSGKLVQWLSCAEAGILRIVELLFKDKEENNKIYLVHTVFVMAKYKHASTLQPYFNLISYQFTWRIRYELISKVEVLAGAMGKENFKSFLIYYIKYLNDIEPEIRSIASLKLQDLIPYIETDDLLSRILPALKNIPLDGKVFVRSKGYIDIDSLASSLLHLCLPVGKKFTTEQILPKFLQFLKDEDEQVRMTIFKKVSLLCDSLGIDTLSQSVLPVISELIGNPNWRIRNQALKIFLYIFQNSPPEAIQEKNIKIVTQFLKDRCHSGRLEAIRVIGKILEKHGQAWFDKNILPKVLPFAKSPNYLHREVVLFLLEHISPILSLDCLSRVVFPLITTLGQDLVSNVKMVACRVYSLVYPLMVKERETIRKLLRILKEDKDVNVREFAETALSIIEAHR